MSDQLWQLELHLDSLPNEDKEDLARLTQQLRQDLLELNVQSVSPVRSSAAPAGAKGDPLSLGALAVTLAPVALTAMTNLLQSWLSRHERASVTLEAEGKKLVITGSPSPDQQRMIDNFIRGRKGEGGASG